MAGNAVMIGGRFAVGPRLGAGMQAEVRAGIDTTTDTPIALKIIDRGQLKRRALDALEREVMIMKTVAHPNVLGLLAFDLEIEFERKPVAVLVLELAEGGELFDYLMYSGYFQESIARTYFQQLVSALQTCHANNIFHRDIKPENILLDSHFQLKLADFGLSNVTQDSDTLLETECGTRSYMAPEVFERRGYSGATADVWSAGVVLFIMLCGSPPFDIANRKDWWFNAISLNRYDRFWAAHLRGAGHMRDRTQAMDFLNKTFVPAVEKRMTLDDMTRHGWFLEESLTNERLYQVMEERKRRVDQAREQERLAAAHTAAQNGNKQGAVNIFDKGTHRSLSGSCPPIYPTTGVPMAEFYTPLSSADGTDLLVRLTRELARLDPSASIEASPGSYSIHATLRLPGETFDMDGEEVVFPPSAPVTFTANVYQATSGENVASEVGVVGLNRQNGELFTFQKLFRQLKDAFTTTTTGSSDEEEFREDIGMI